MKLFHNKYDIVYVMLNINIVTTTLILLLQQYSLP